MPDERGLTRDEMFARMIEVETAATRLLHAMDAQWGNAPFSMNVDDARRALAALFPIPRDSSDEARIRA
jgi:hypothetical protein